MAISDTAKLVLPAGTYEIDPGASTVRFDTRASFGLLPVHGTFTISHGRITVTESPEESSVQVVMDAASFDSGNQQRDNHVKSPDFLDVARHPEIAFQSQSLQRSAQQASLQGELTACGTTHPVLVAINTVACEDEQITATGTATVDRFAFGVTKARGMAGRHLKITLEIVASR
ncbi:YceI family protein [Streptomyces monashensis]|uniref:YceI family protein n=1 Tax=Streptomyces monashensis TaxID=1678012 RepID=UPI0033C02821